MMTPTADTPPQKTDPTPRKRRLTSHNDVKRYLADIINRVESGELDPKKAAQLTHMTTIVLNLITAIEKDFPKIPEGGAIQYVHQDFGENERGDNGFDADTE
jgi:hypothetical protein